MTYENDGVFQHLAQELEDESNARAEMAWSIEPKAVDPIIELAAKRELPPGHVAFLGNKALPPFKPKY